MSRKPKSNQFIGVWTPGMMELSSDIRELVEKDFDEQVRQKDDWFYVVEVRDQKFFIADNGEFGYTAMLPEEY